MNNIEQSDDGTVFAIAYQDNGKYFLSVLSNTGEELDNFDVSGHLMIDDRSKPIDGFMEPLITCCFIDNNNLFISVYHRL